MDSNDLTNSLYHLLGSGTLHDLAREVGKAMAEELHRLQKEDAKAAAVADSGDCSDLNEEAGRSACDWCLLRSDVETYKAALASLAPSAKKPDWIALSRHLEIVKDLRAIVDEADALVKSIDGDEEGEGRYDVAILARLKKLLPPRPGAEAAKRDTDTCPGISDCEGPKP